MDFIDLKTQYRALRDDIGARIQAVLEHGQYIMGPEIDELERKLADYVGVKHAIAVSSGTDALLIAMLAYDIGPGDEVITTPFTFIATGEMIALIGAKPVFVDIDPKTYNLDPALLEQAITEQTKAIVPVSLYGQCADFDALNAIARQHRIPVIEDGAQSFGATYKGQKSCGLSEIGCTSFFPSKPLGGYGDSGACFTNDDALAKKMREIRVHGQDRRYHHPLIGINGRMDTLQAAVLLSKLTVFSEEVQARERLGRRYSALLTGVARTPFIETFNTSVYAQYTIEVDDRERVQEVLKGAGIPTAVHYPVPLNLQPAFAALKQPAGSFPCAETAARRVISLPMHPYLTDSQQDSVVAAVRSALG
jgi:UDP-2-acetamido-2-deoxy-ribo-hexuluronate aminotransferase